MRKTGFIILLCIVFIGLYVYLNHYENQENRYSAPCENPVTYRVGTIGSTYNLSKDKLRNILREIDDAWSGTLGKNLFTYSDDGTITVNLMYGNQQQRLNKEQSVSTRIESKKISFEATRKKWKRLKQQFDDKKQEYDQLVEEYNSLQQNSYSQAELAKVRAEMNKKEVAIKQKQRELNRLTDRINKKAAQLNEIAEEIDTMIADYNNNYGTKEEFNQGDYKKDQKGERINIYSYRDLDELRLVLAHEMGHALGLGHVENSSSVMYYLIENQKKGTLVFTDEDIQALKNQCSGQVE